MKSKDPCSLEEKLWKTRQHIKKQRHHFADKSPCSRSYGFSSSHVWMWDLDYKQSWELKNWCFWIVVLEKTLEGPLVCKEIKPVNDKGNKPWILLVGLEKEMATHSSILAWRIPGTEEPSGLLSMGSHRVRHNWSDLAAAEQNIENTVATEATCTVFQRKVRQLGIVPQKLIAQKIWN